MTQTTRATRPEPLAADIEVARTSIPKWAIGEFFGTFLLVFFGCGSVCTAVATGAQPGVFQVAIVWGVGIATAIYFTDSLSGAHLTAATNGLTVTLLISLLGPLTMACFNPARDFAPRLFSMLAGWKSIPFTTNGSGWCTVYICAPIIGGLLGGGIYRAFFRPGYRA